MEFELNLDHLKKFAYEIVSRLKNQEKPIFLCVGSDKFVCDSMAPIVGEMLTQKYNINTFVYGGLEYNINANNVSQAINYIESRHPCNPVVVIDATLGENVGKVRIDNGSYVGLAKVLPIRKLGNFSILGVVGKNHKNFDLNSTRLQVVMSLAKFISKGIAMSMDYLEKSCYV